MISKDNKLVKLAKKLKLKKNRDKENLFIAEGLRFVESAIESNSVKYILYSEKIYSTNGYDRILKNKEAVFEIPNETLMELCDTENPQGVIAICYKKEYELENIPRKLLIIVDGVQDPGNLGTIIRTSDAAGVSGIIVLKGTVDIYNPKVLRSTMGSIFNIPIILKDDFAEVSSALLKEGYNIVTTSLEGKKSLYEYDFSKKTAIILGNEANGVSEEVLNISTEKIIIPMEGKSESLNVAIANSIIVYEALRQRNYN